MLAKLKMLSLMLGFGSAADFLTLDQVRERAQGRINAIRQLHPGLEQKAIDTVLSELRSSCVKIADNGQVEVRALPDLFNSLEQQLVLGFKGNAIALPEQLRQLPRVFHLVSHYQLDNFSCGYRALFNARGIQAVLNNENLTAEAIAQQAVRLLPQMAPRHVAQRTLLEPDEVAQAAQNLQLNNAHVLLRQSDMNNEVWLNDDYANLQIRRANIEQQLQLEWVDRFNARPADQINEHNARPRRGALATEAEIAVARQNSIDTAIELNRRNELDMQHARAAMLANLDNMRNQFNQNVVLPNRNGALHFVCLLTDGNTNKDEHPQGVHWILISIVKRVNRRPVMLIMDSKNSPACSQVTSYAQFIYDRIITPLN